jgi:hypothetical protein
MPTNTHAQPKCRKCGSADIRATSSQQYRRINGEKRLVADAVCNNCSHSWWSYHPAIKALAREADAERVDA